MMNTPMHALLLCFALLFADTTFAAQPDASADAGNAAPATSDSAETEAPDAEAAEQAPPANIDEALAEEIRAGEAAQAAAAPGSNDETFVPSVQISEDLSVSFPVDI